MLFRQETPKLEEKKEEPETFFSRINPVLKDIAINGAKGYVFGSFVGLINSKPCVNETFSEMHQSGIKFMSLGMLYTGSESLLENIREKKDYLNSVGASAIAGGILLGRQSLKKGVLGGIGFSIYTGLNNFPVDLKENFDNPRMK